jgi:hypothetical protein
MLHREIIAIYRENHKFAGSIPDNVTGFFS